MNKKKNLYKKIIIICLCIAIFEIVVMGIIKIFRERSIDRVNILYDVAKIDDGYIAVGESDFHNSKFVKETTYEHTNEMTGAKSSIITSQSRIAKYDTNKKLIWEKTYSNKYDGTFYSVLPVSDGYIAVGSIVSDYKQIDVNTRTALIVKFDLDGNVLWKNTYSILSDTEFYKVVLDNDKYIVIGQSIYQNLEVGNHITGGGIIVSYDKDGNLLAHNNYGGNKSGIFNDIIVMDDGYIVCGKDASNYGILVKFTKDFDREENVSGLISKKVMWQRTYSNTDENGFMGIAKIDDKLYVVGALNVSNEKDEEGNTIFKYDAGWIVYDINGKYLDKFTMNEDTHHRFNSVTNDKDYLYLSMQLDTDSYYDGKPHKTAIIKYDLANKKVVDRYTFAGNNSFAILKLTRIDNKNMYIGTENNNCTLYGCDYRGVFDYYEDLKTE